MNVTDPITYFAMNVFAVALVVLLAIRWRNSTESVTAVEPAVESRAERLPPSPHRVHGSESTRLLHDGLYRLWLATNGTGGYTKRDLRAAIKYHVSAENSPSPTGRPFTKNDLKVIAKHIGTASTKHATKNEVRRMIAGRCSSIDYSSDDDREFRKNELQKLLWRVFRA